jgi:hypothetical protein
MRKIIKLGFLLSIIFTLVPTFVYSINLGSFIKTDSFSIEAGERASFDIFFWNLEDPYYLKINSEQIPEGWEIRITPNDFLVETAKKSEPPFNGDQYINLPRVGVIEPYKVRVSVYTSADSNKGKYYIALTALAYNKNNEISVSQERDIKLKINLLRSPEDENDNGEIDEEVDENQEELYDLLESIQERVEVKPKKTNEDKRGVIDENIVDNENKTNKNPLTAKVISSMENGLKNKKILILIGILILTAIGSVVIYKYA